MAVNLLVRLAGSREMGVSAGPFLYLNLRLHYPDLEVNTFSCYLARQCNRGGRRCLERLRHIREQAGYSQQDLADESGVSQHTISEIELGRRKPQGRTLRKLAGVLGVEVRDLFKDAHPLAQAPPSPEQPNFNGLLEEERRGDFLQSCRRYVQSRAEHYERRLAEAQEGGFFAGHGGSLILLGEALEEYDELGALLAGHLPDLLFVEDRSDDAVMRAAVEAAAALRPLFKTLERISDRADELAETEAQKAEAAIRREEMRAHTERLSA